tara:strand:+ start:4172 stop:4366 length:195 start_codon:yes stop_codon:yes gene_type:complete
MIDHSHDLGKLEAQVEQLRVDVVKLSTLVEANSAQLNKWRGAGAVLILIGAVGGWLISLMIPKL